VLVETLNPAQSLTHSLTGDPGVTAADGKNRVQMEVRSNLNTPQA